MDDTGTLTATAETSLSAIGRDDWNACAGAHPPPGGGHPPNPFVTYEFLNALEETGCASADTGWLAQHIAVRDAEGTVLAVMPCYLKSHSYGEYVFDHSWAQAFENAGGRYYPKLQASVPFTPVPGPRFLARPEIDRTMAAKALLSAATQLTDRIGASSLHITFLEEQEWEEAGSFGLLRRTDQQFHWANDGYTDFDAFLSALASRKRKTIRRERRKALEDGIEIEWLSGGEITEAHWDTFFHFYMDTGSRKWGRPYLDRDFFSRVGEQMADDILLVMARSGGRYVAGALNFIGARTLYGRHWGCVEYHDSLHFEVCYYQAIDYAITHGLETVEAGAQGPHKLARGYMPVTTYSAHYITNPGLARAVAQYLDDERCYVEAENAALARHAPFRKEGGD